MLASGVARCACTSIPRALAAVCVLARYIAILAFWRAWPVIVSFWTALLSICSALTSHKRGDSVYSPPPPPFPISTDLLRSVMGACFLP